MNLTIFLIVLPLALAFLSIISSKIKLPLLILGVITNAFLVFFIEKGITIIGGYQPPYGINLLVDSYNLYFLIIINVLFALLVLVNLHAVEKLATVVLVALAGLNGLMLTGDLFNLFVFMEIATIAAYIILSMDQQPIKVFHYIIIGSVGSSLYLLGIVILYAQYGTLNMVQMAGLIESGSIVPVVGYVLVFAGMAVETKLLPFNSWVKGILESAKGFTGPLIGSIYAGVMLVVFGRLFGDVFMGSDALFSVLMIIGIVTLLLAEVMAFASKKLRHIWLFSSIAQSGLVVVLFLSHLNQLAVLVIAANILSKFVLYLMTGKIVESTGTDQIDDLQGILVTKKPAGIAFTIAALSLIGLPLFFGFFVKINTLIGLIATDYYLIPGLILISALVESAYVIRLLVRLWQKAEEGEKPTIEVKTELRYKMSFLACATTIIIALGLVVFGVMPDGAITAADKAGTTLNYTQPVDLLTMEGGIK